MWITRSQQAFRAATEALNRDIDAGKARQASPGQVSEPKSGKRAEVR
jgi:hypothetical protein